MACGADRLTSHPHVRPLLEHCGRMLQAAAGPDLVLAYSAGNQRDTEGARQVAAVLPSARLLSDARFADHSLLYQLHRRGELAGFLSHALLAPRSPAVEARCSA